MLKLPNQLTDPKANEIIKTFVNEEKNIRAKVIVHPWDAEDE